MEYVSLEGNWLWQEIERTREELRTYPQWIQDEINGFTHKGANPMTTPKLPWRRPVRKKKRQRLEDQVFSMVLIGVLVMAAMLILASVL